MVRGPAGGPRPFAEESSTLGIAVDFGGFTERTKDGFSDEASEILYNWSNEVGVPGNSSLTSDSANILLQAKSLGLVEIADLKNRLERLEGKYNVEIDDMSVQIVDPSSTIDINNMESDEF